MFKKTRFKTLFSLALAFSPIFALAAQYQYFSIVNHSDLAGGGYPSTTTHPIPLGIPIHTTVTGVSKIKNANDLDNRVIEDGEGLLFRLSMKDKAFKGHTGHLIIELTNNKDHTHLATMKITMKTGGIDTFTSFEATDVAPNYCFDLSIPQQVLTAKLFPASHCLTQSGHVVLTNNG